MTSTNSVPTGEQAAVPPHEPPPYGRHHVTARTLPQHHAPVLIAYRRGTLLRRRGVAS